MRRLAYALCVLCAQWLSSALLAQSSGITRLVVRVEPDVLLSEPRVALRFYLDPASPSSVTSQTAVITARVRTLPGQRIRLLAQASALAGPAGDLPASSIGWTGASINPSAQSGEAACTSGTFRSSVLQDLVSGWGRSGTVTCEITFSLAAPDRLPPGAYSGIIDLTVRTE